MEKERANRKHSKLLATIMFLIVLIIATIIWLIYDYTRIVNYSEVAKSKLSSLIGISDDDTLIKGKVIAKYVDKDGNEIAPSEEFEGKIGDEYRVERKDIYGYTFLGEEPVNKAGNFQKEDAEVVFVYKSEKENVDILEENNVITVKMKNAKQPKEYDLKIVTEDEKGNLVKGVDYTVTESTGRNLRSGTVNGKSFVVGTLTINEEGVNIYSILEDAGTYYESLVDGSIDFSINKTWNNKKKEFEIALDCEETYEGVSFEVKEKEIIVKIINKKLEIPEIPTEPNIPDEPEEPDVPDMPDEPAVPDEPNTPNEPEDLKVFDLSITKYISNIKVQNRKGTKEINRGYEDKDKIVKLEVASKEMATTTLTIKYKVLIENKGNVPGYATEISDYIPKDLRYIDDGNWELNNRKLTCKVLKDKLLNPGEKQELEVSFEWRLDSSSSGSRKNEVEITVYNNDLELKDLTPDNVGSAEMVIAVKTGKEQISILAILTTLVIIAIVVYAEKRRIEKEEVK